MQLLYCKFKMIFCIIINPLKSKKITKTTSQSISVDELVNLFINLTLTL